MSNFVNFKSLTIEELRNFKGTEAQNRAVKAELNTRFYQALVSCNKALTMSLDLTKVTLSQAEVARLIEMIRARARNLKMKKVVIKTTGYTEARDQMSFFFGFSKAKTKGAYELKL